MRSFKPLLVYAVTLIAAVMLGQMVISGDYDKIGLLGLAIVMLIVGLSAPIEFLIYLTFYVLVAGSSYDQVVRRQVFYLRFGVFALYLIRFIPLMVQRSRDHQMAGPLGPPKEPLFRWTFFHTLMTCYLALACISTAYSIDRSTTIQRFVAIGILFSAVFLFLYEVSDSWEKVASYMKVMVRSTIALLMFGFLFYVLGFERTVQSTGRLRLFLFGPNELGYICAILFPACFWYYDEARSLLEKNIARVGLVLLITALVLTASRGSLFCFAISGLLLVWLSYRKRLIFYLSTVFVALSVTYIFAPPQTDRLLEVFSHNIVRSETLESGSGRLPIWDHALELSRSRPYFGYGFGTVNTLFQMGYFTSAQSSFQGEYLHNSYLELLLDLGVFGVILLLLALFYVGVKSIKLIRTAENSPHRRIIVMVFCCFFSGVTSAIFETWLTSPGSVFSFPFWYCVALLMRMHFLPLDIDTAKA